MDKIIIKVNSADALLVSAPTLTKGMQGLQAQFIFSDEWKGLGKVVFARAGLKNEAIVINGDTADIPATIMADSGVNLIIGLYGTDGTKMVIPTVWCGCGEILPAGDVADSDNYAEPTSDEVNQIIALVQTAANYALASKEAAESVAGLQIVDIESDNSEADQTGEARVAITEDTSSGSRIVTFHFANLKGRSVAQLSADEDGNVTLQMEGEDPQTITAIPDAIERLYKAFAEYKIDIDKEVVELRNDLTAIDSRLSESILDISSNTNVLSQKHDFEFLPITKGEFYRWDNGYVDVNTNYSRTTDIISVNPSDSVKFLNHVADILAIIFYKDGEYISRNLNALEKYDIPNNANGFGITFKNPISGYIAYENLTKIYNTTTNSFNLYIITSWVRWDNGNRESSNALKSTKAFHVKAGRTYTIVSNAIVRAFCYYSDGAFVSGNEARNATTVTIPSNIDSIVIDFEYSDDDFVYLYDSTEIIHNETNGKKLGCLGDSITQGVGNNDHSWVDKMQEMCGFASVVNYGVSGNTIEQMYERYSSMDNDCDYITLMGGTNNALWSTSQTLEQFKTNFESLVLGLVSKYPSSKILGITPIKFDYHSGSVSRNWNVATANGLKLIDFVDAEIEIYNKYSIPVLDLFRTSNIMPDVQGQKVALLADGVHPNEVGYFKYLAPKIANALKMI